MALNETKVFKEVIEKNGADRQLEMVIEECSELIQAICKYRRARHNSKTSRRDLDKRIDSIIEEVADVQIMLYQLPLMDTEWDRESFVNEVKGTRIRKIERLQERLNKGK